MSQTGESEDDYEFSDLQTIPPTTAHSSKLPTADEYELV